MSGSAAMIAFAKARLDEDEARASAALPRWHDDQMEWEDLGDEVYSHARRHDPARVLREVEAKRVILAEHEPRLARPGDGHWHGLDDRLRCRVCASATEDRWLRFIAPCWTLATLIAVWSDHPDYDASWKP